MIDAQVIGADRDPATGDVTALRLDAGDPVAGDVFFDCTGFRRALIVREMGADWQSFGDRMPVNRAMPFWLDIEHGAEIPPYTLAWAREAGWMWSIPTQTRIGCGYVYSDRFLDAEGAQAEIERRSATRSSRATTSASIPAGSTASAIGNVIALGLASAFLEPLEATSIHGTVVQLMLLAPMLRQDPGPHRRDRPRPPTTRVVARQVDDFRDFINLHYVTERDDTPFWRHVRADCIGAPTRERLALWRRKMPDRDDFQPLPGRPRAHRGAAALPGAGRPRPARPRRRAGRMAEVPKLRASARGPSRA